MAASFTDNCGILRVAHARDHTSYPYELSSCTLQPITETVDLGFHWHLTYPGILKRKNVVNKANKIADFRKWNVRSRNKVISLLYKALVIPILEYEVPLCSPYSKKNIAVLKRFKRRASSMLSWRLSAVWRKTGSAWVIQSPINEDFFIFVRVLYDYSWS